MRKIIAFFNLAFPKAGTKFHGFPVYISLLYLLFLPVLFWRLIKDKNGLMSGCIIVLFFSIFSSSLLQLILFGVSKWNLEYYFQYIIPMISVLAYYWVSCKKESKKYDKIFIVSFLIISIFGILQKIAGDYTLVIPGLTANYHDAQIADFLAHKNNMVWSINYLKLTSTYQNGNLFGVNFILIFWVYFYHIRNYIFISILSIILYVIICILSASATVYFGMLVSLIIFCMMNFNQILQFIIKRSFLFFLLFVVFLFAVYFFVIHGYLSHLLEARLLDRPLLEGGGRTEKIIAFFQHIHAHPVELFTGNANPSYSIVYEVTPMATLQALGIFPFILFSVCLFLIIKPIYKLPLSIGLISYLFASLVDGGFWLPPTAFNLFFIAGYINKRFVD